MCQSIKFRILVVLLCAVNIITTVAFGKNETVTIVIPSSENQTLSFAASELSYYFKKMAGSDCMIVRNAKKTAKTTVTLRIDTGLSHDGYKISNKKGDIYVSGGSPRGCLYGSYMLLHELGCRFPLPGKENEVVPKLEKISWSGKEIKSEPVIGHRGFVLAPDSYSGDNCFELIDYLAKNRFNFLDIHYSVTMPTSEFLSKLKNSLVKRDMGFDWGGHILASYLPRELFKEHPEYFRMVDGKRIEKLNMCPSSPGAADVIAKNVLQQFSSLKNIPRFETLHLYSDDLETGGWCSCPKCSHLTDSDQSLKILNEIAKRLPLGDTRIDAPAYHATISSPETVKTQKSVRLLYAPRERCYKHAIDQCKKNQWYFQKLKENIKWFPNEPAVFEYYFDLILFRANHMPLHQIIGKDIEAYHNVGINRICSLSFQNFSDWAYGSNQYVYGKCLWRGKGSPDDIKEYCDAVYGPASEQMNTFFDMLSDLCSTTMELCGYDGMIDMRYPGLEPFTETHIDRLAPFVTDKNLNGIENLLVETENAAQEPYKSRIQEQYVLWQATRLDVQSIYKTMLAMYKFDKLKDDSLLSNRQYVLALARQGVEYADAAMPIRRSPSEDIRGRQINMDSCAILWQLNQIIAALEPESVDPNQPK